MYVSHHFTTKWKSALTSDSAPLSFQSILKWRRNALQNHWSTGIHPQHIRTYQYIKYVQVTNNLIHTYTHTYININLPSLGQLRWERCSNGSEDRTPHPISTSLVLSSESYTIQYIHTWKNLFTWIDRSTSTKQAKCVTWLPRSYLWQPIQTKTNPTAS